MSESNISTLREALFAQLKELRETSEPGQLQKVIDKSKAVSELGQVLIASARVEIDYLKQNGGGETTFLDGAIANNNLPPGITGRTVHRLKG